MREGKLCPGGEYCAGGMSLPQVCPEDTKCPEGSSSPEPCPALFKSPRHSRNCSPSVGFWIILGATGVVLIIVGVIIIIRFTHNPEKQQTKEEKEISDLIPKATGPQYSGL